MFHIYSAWCKYLW